MEIPPSVPSLRSRRGFTPMCCSISSTTRTAHSRLSGAVAVALAGGALSAERGSLSLIFLLLPFDLLRDSLFLQVLPKAVLLSDRKNVVGENVEAQSGRIIENDRGKKNRHHICHHFRLCCIHHLRLQLLGDNHRDTQKQRQDISRVLVSQVRPEWANKRLAVYFIRIAQRGEQSYPHRHLNKHWEATAQRVYLRLLIHLHCLEILSLFVLREFLANLFDLRLKLLHRFAAHHRLVRERHQRDLDHHRQADDRHPPDAGIDCFLQVRRGNRGLLKPRDFGRRIVQLIHFLRAEISSKTVAHALAGHHLDRKVSGDGANRCSGAEDAPAFPTSIHRK